MNGVQQSIYFSKHHILDASQKILLNYRDGGRRISFSESGEVLGQPNREIIVVKNAGEDPVLWTYLENLKKQTQGMTAQQKAKFLFNSLRSAMPERNPQKNEESMRRIANVSSLSGVEMTLGDVLESGSAVCRHYALIFKIASDYIGVPASLRRGEFRYSSGQKVGHAWNEVVLEDGNRILIDVMHGAGCDLYNPYATHYHTVNNEPMYEKEVLNTMPWFKVNDRHGKACLYLDASKINDEQKKSLDTIFQRYDIQYETKFSGLNGGMNVIVISGESIQKLRQVMGVGRPKGQTSGSRHHVSMTGP